MESHFLPTRPLIKNSLSATSEWQAWLKENDYHRIVDMDGLAWQMTMKVDQLPAREELHAGMWAVSLGMTAHASKQELVRSEVLDPIEDERTLALIPDDASIEFALKPTAFEALGEKQARDELAKAVSQLRENLKITAMRAIKRSIVFKWLDEQGKFGKREQMRGW